MIDRRTALAGMATLFSVPLYAPIARAAGLAGKAARPVISDGPPSVEVFTPSQKAAMTALSERVLPTTDTPGAIAAGVPDYIEKLLADWALPDERIPIIAMLDQLDAKSLADNKTPVAKATPEQRERVRALRRASDAKDSPERRSARAEIALSVHGIDSASTPSNSISTPRRRVARQTSGKPM